MLLIRLKVQMAPKSHFQLWQTKYNQFVCFGVSYRINVGGGSLRRKGNFGVVYRSVCWDLQNINFHFNLFQVIQITYLSSDHLRNRPVDPTNEGPRLSTLLA